LGKKIKILSKQFEGNITF